MAEWSQSLSDPTGRINEIIAGIHVAAHTPTGVRRQATSDDFIRNLISPWSMHGSVPTSHSWRGIQYRFTYPSDGKKTTWDPITTSRILTLDERVQQPARDFINAAESEPGVRLRVSHARRSIDEQNKIWQKGRDANGNKIGKTYTNVRGGKSAHNFGLAIDVVLIPNVNTIIPPEVAEIGERYGFEWGGRWNNPRDFPHFQMYWINGRGPR